MEANTIFYFSNGTSISSYLTEINRYSFPTNLRNLLTKVVMGNAVTSVLTGAFLNCDSLTQVTFSQNLRNIDSFAFSLCDSLTTLNLPSSLKNIAEQAFSETKNIITINGTNNVTYFGTKCFSKCVKLTTINISSALHIGDYCFLQSGISNIIIPNNLTYLGVQCFNNCQNLKSINIPNTLIYISNGCFSNCLNLSSVTISDSANLKYIDDFSFLNCNNLLNISIPINVAKIGSNCFEGCRKLENIYFKAPNNITTDGINIFKNIGHNIKMYLKGVKNLSGVTSNALLNIMKQNLTLNYIPIEITNSTYFIYDNTIVTPPIQPSVLTQFIYLNGEIEYSKDTILTRKSYTKSFLNLVNVKFGTAVTQLSDNCFAGCLNLTTLVIDELSNISSIGAFCFSGCNKLNSIIIKNNKIKSISRGCFNECFNLVSFAYNNSNTLIDTIIIPPSITKIEDDAFKKCSSITKIIIHDRFTEFGNNVFNGCIKLINIQFNDCNSLLSCGTNLFFGINNTITIRLIGLLHKGQITSNAFLTLANQNPVDINGNVPLLYSSYYVYDINTDLTKTLFFFNGGDLIVSDDTILTNNIIVNNISQLTEVIIGSTATKISENCFNNCINLPNINIPNNILSIDNNAFDGCVNITNIILPSTLTLLSKECFKNCVKLKTLNIPNTVSEMQEGCFFNCSSLETISIPAGISYLSPFLFYNCLKLSSITIPNQVTKINNNCFELCKKLTNITIPNSVTNIGNDSFSTCENLTSLFIPKTVIVIGNSCFNDCTELDSLVFENCNYLTSVGNNLFTNVPTITMYLNNLYSSDDIISSAFIALSKQNLGNPSLNSVYYRYYLQDPSTVLFYYNDMLNITIGNNGQDVPNKQDIYKISIGSSVQTLANYYFKDYTGIESIIIPNNITYIGEGCFENCTNLKQIKLSENIIQINVKCFKNCSNINNIIIPAKIENIYDNCFENCVSLNYINFLNCNNLSSVGTNIFAGILNSIIIKLTGLYTQKNIKSSSFLNLTLQNPGNPTPALDSNYYEYNFITDDNIIILYIDNTIEVINSISGSITGNKALIIDIEIKSGVLTLKDELFKDLTTIKEIIIPNTVQSIGSKCFENCSNLTKIELSNNVSIIKSNCFKNCVKLTSITINNSVTSLENNCFDNCTGLTSIIFNSCNLISYCGSDIFKNIQQSIYFTLTGLFNQYNITSLAALKLFNSNPGNPTLNSNFYLYETSQTIYIKQNGEQITTTSPTDILDIVNIIIDPRINVIDDNYFENYINLTNINIPSNITQLGKNCFKNCINLTAVNFSQNIKILGIGSFTGCIGLSSINIIDSITEIQNNCFDGCVNLTLINFSNCNNITNVGQNIFKNILNSIKMRLFGLFNTSNVLSDAFLNLTLQNPPTNNIPSLNSSYYIYDEYPPSTILYYNDNTQILINSTLLDSGINELTNKSNIVKVIVAGNVTAIGDYYFAHCINLTSITILGNIENIGINCFENCNKLKNILIPNTVTYIGDSSFKNCMDLISITLPNSVTSVGNQLFYNCINLTHIELSENLSTLSDNLFEKCISLTEIIIPNSIKEINQECFLDCINLNKITFLNLNNLIFCGTNIFKNISNSIFITLNGIFKKSEITSTAFLSLVEQNPGNPNIESSYYIYTTSTEITKYYDNNNNDMSNSNISNVVKISIGTSNTEITDMLFKDYINLTTIYIPNTITKFGNNCFENCSNLKTIIFQNINDIKICGTNIFNNITNSITMVLKGLSNVNEINETSIFFDIVAQNPNANNIDAIYYIYDINDQQTIYIYKNSIYGSYDTFLTPIIKNKDLLNEVIIGPTVTKIDDNCFQDCKNLKSIIISEAVTSLGNSCFSGCSSLTSIIINSNNLILGDKCFSYCFELKDITIPNCINKLSLSCFEGCLNLENITINDSVNMLDSYCFSGCISIKTLIIPSSVTIIGDNCFISTNSLNKIIMRNANALTFVGNNVFSDNHNQIVFILTGIFNQTDIISNAFKSLAIQNSNIYGLSTSLYVYENETIYNRPSVFYYNNGINIKIYSTLLSSFDISNVSLITKVTVGPFVTKLGNGCFENCVNLKTVEFITSNQTASLLGVTEIGIYCFKNCTNLTDIILPKNLSILDDNSFIYCSSISSITIPSSVTKIGIGCFKDCINITEILYDISNNNINDIGIGAFSDCIKLTNIQIPTGLTKLSDYLFQNCSSLTEIMIPNNIILIGSNCFYGCNNLNNINFDTLSILETLGSSCFSRCVSLMEITIPSNVTSINDYCFNDCFNLNYIVFANPNNLSYCGNYIFENIENNITMKLTGLTSSTEINEAFGILTAWAPNDPDLSGPYYEYDQPI